VCVVVAEIFDGVANEGGGTVVAVVVAVVVAIMPEEVRHIL